MTICCVIPAHNEESGIRAAILSVVDQVDEVWVIADNCTDKTVLEALRSGAGVYETVGNTDKKAGALNQFIPMLLRWMDDADRILVMDADSTISPDFVKTALDYPGSIVGGVFYGDPGGGLVDLLQRNEYARFARDIYSKGDKAMVLTGTATLHEAGALRAIQFYRGKSLPGFQGQIYDTAVLTEDNEITLALKTLGYKCVSPEPCKVFTEVMPTWSDLWNQRLRWQRGALENIRQYGLTSTTFPYVRQQAVMMFGVLAMFLYMVVTAYQILTHQFHLGWLSLVGLVFVLERVVTVSSRGLRQQIFAATLIPEMLYDFFLQAVLIRSLFDMLRGKEATWHHITKENTNVS